MNKKTITNVITSLLILLLFAGVFAVIFRFTNGFEEDFKSFYVTYNGKDIFATKNKLFLPRGEEHRFDVKYTFDFLEDGETEVKDYNVKIVPKVDEDTDFTFTVDGKEYAYSSVSDLTKGFQIFKYDTYFILSITEATSLESVLEAVCGKDVECPTDESRSSSYLYTLVISSYDESVTYYIDFAFGVMIELDVSEVVF